MMQLERYTKSLGESKQNQVSVLAPRVQVSATFSVTASVGGPHRKTGSKTGTWCESRRRLWVLAVVRPGPGPSSIHLAGWARPGWAEEGGPSLERLHTKPNELRVRETNRSVDQNLGFVEQNKKEPVAVQGPGTPAIKPKHLLGLGASLAVSAAVPRRWG